MAACLFNHHDFCSSLPYPILTVHFFPACIFLHISLSNNLTQCLLQKKCMCLTVFFLLVCLFLFPDISAIQKCKLACLGSACGGLAIDGTSIPTSTDMPSSPDAVELVILLSFVYRLLTRAFLPDTLLSGSRLLPAFLLVVVCTIRNCFLPLPSCMLLGFGSCLPF